MGLFHGQSGGFRMVGVSDSPHFVTSAGTPPKLCTNWSKAQASSLCPVETADVQELVMVLSMPPGKHWILKTGI